MTRAAIYLSIKEVEKLARQLDIHTSIPALHALEAAVMRLFACVSCTRVMEERVIFKALDQAHDKVCAQKNMYEGTAPLNPPYAPLHVRPRAQAR